MNTTFRSISIVAVSLGLLLNASTKLSAQADPFRDAGAKIRGDAYWPARASSRHLEAARNYSQEFHNYLVKTPQPEPAVVKEATMELARYLEESKKHLATMKKDFAADKDVLAAVEHLEKELATAIDHHKEMIACCAKETLDKLGAMACCSDLSKQIDKIHAEHTDLMRKLSRKFAAPAGTK